MNSAVLKGAVLIFLALLLGAFLLANGVDTNTSSGSSAVPTTAPPTTASGPSTAAGATTTTVRATSRPPDQVTVLVANATSVGGAASKVSDQLSAKGYVTAEPSNATKLGASKTSVYYVGNDRPEAIAVAQALGLSQAVVAEMPNPAPVSDLRGSTVLVVVGADKASGQ